LAKIWRSRFSDPETVGWVTASRAGDAALVE